MKIKIDFSYENILNKIGGDFPFFTIHRIMDVTGWKYYNSNNTPSIDQITKTLYGLLKSVKSGECIGTGGFDVELKNNNYNITFTIGTFAFSKKSADWDNGDLIYLNSFIKRVQETEVIITSNFMMIREDEKPAFFAKKCDAFIDSGKYYDYDKELGLLFTKESYEDEDNSTVYELRFIGVDKDFII
jgi:hypothetical protein